VSELLFEKALAEPHFAAMYARLCLVLCQAVAAKPYLVPQQASSGVKTEASFKFVLLNKCEREFEAGCDDVDVSGAVDDSGNADEEAARELRTRQRRRMHGNIRFIRYVSAGRDICLTHAYDVKPHFVPLM
jgi:hypothetical protein